MHPKRDQIIGYWCSQVGLGFKARIEEMTRIPEHKEIRFRLKGVAKRISTGSSEALQDHRLTQFHTLKKSQWLVWIGILGWITATILGWYRLYEEMKG